jgi:hypothetical protein
MELVELRVAGVLGAGSSERNARCGENGTERCGDEQPPSVGHGWSPSGSRRARRDHWVVRERSDPERPQARLLGIEAMQVPRRDFQPALENASKEDES